MKLRYLLPLALIVLFACGKKKPAPTEINFITDFAQAKQMAESSKMPMVIDFYTDWCKWCDSLDVNTYVDPVVIGMSADMVFAKINAEKDTALAKEYKVTGYPTIIVAKSDGEEIDRIWGYMPPTDFYNQVQLYLQGKETLADYLTRLEDDPDNLEYLSIVGEKYASRAMFDKALETYEKIVSLDSDNSRGYGLKAMESSYDTKARNKDYDGAIAICKQIMDKFPDTENADDAEAMIAYYTAKKGDNAEALKLFRQYLKNRPEGVNAGWIKERVADMEDKS